MKTLNGALLALLMIAVSLTTVVGLDAAPAEAQAASCVPGTWVSPPNDLWDPRNGSYPIQAESDHFQVRWPAEKPDLVSEADVEQMLIEMEAVFGWFTGPEVGWPEPFCDAAEKHKVQIFSDVDYGLAGAGGGQRSPAMWVASGALAAAAQGQLGGMVHEFTHTMQFSSEGLRDTILGGWLWESHAEFMRNQYGTMRNGVGCTDYLAFSPHIYYGNSRVRYCNGQFWDFLKNKHGFQAVNSMFVDSAGVPDQDPFFVLRESQGFSQQDLGDLFGEFAMHNVNWDYTSPDGFDRGAAYRGAFGPNTEVSRNVAQHLRLARMEAIDEGQRQYVVSDYFAPQRYGYNLVRLMPEADATEMTVDFRGVVQDEIVPGAEIGQRDYQPEAPGPWADYDMPTDPASNWRWGVVAIDDAGASRYSDLQTGPTGQLTFDILPTDRDFYLTVAATPDEHHSVFWDQMYHTLYRYPYKIQLTGAYAEGFEPGYRNEVRHEYPAGAVHPNGGGWVANDAEVDASVFVGPNAAVLGGQVLGNARIEDYAAVWNGVVRDNAIVGGLSQLNRNLTVEGDAEFRSVLAHGQVLNGGNGVIGGTAKMFGDLEVYLSDGPWTAGSYSGYVNANFDADIGQDRDALPVEVTAATPAGWADDTPRGPFGGVAWALPGEVQAEDYDDGGAGVAFGDSELANKGGAYRSDAVDIWSTSGEVGFTVGSTRGGEFTEYTVDAGAGGSFDVGLRVASGNANPGGARVFVDGDLVGELADVPADGWWNFSEVPVGTVTMTPGIHVVRVEWTGAGQINFDRINFTEAQFFTGVVALSNPSFESPVLGDGQIGGMSPGWTGGNGTFNPGEPWYDNLPGNANSGTMSGANSAFFFGTGAAPLEQITGSTVAAETVYTLTAAIGGRTSAESFAGARVEILANGTPVAENTIAAPPVAGSFGDLAVTWAADAANDGATLGVRISPINPAGGTYLDIDNVRLTTLTPGEPPVIGDAVSQDCASKRDVAGADVVLLIGQSNMSGYGQGFDPAIDGVQDARIKQWSRANSIVSASEPLQHADWSAGQQRVGMGTSFARTYLPTVPAQRTVLLVPAAFGGTGLNDGADGWTPGVAMNRAPFIRLFDDAVDRLTAALDSNAGNCVAAILWHQGENDIGNSNYAANLDNMITTLRTQQPRAAQSPFILGEFAPQWVAQPQLVNSPTVLATLAVINDTPNRLPYTAVAPSAGLPSNGNDLIHFSGAGMRAYGERYFDALAEANGNVVR